MARNESEAVVLVEDDEDAGLAFTAESPRDDPGFGDDVAE